MSQRGLFGRTVILEAGQPGTTGKRFAGLRTVFNVEHRSGSLGRARIDLYNAGEQALEFLKPRRNEIRLKVGYDGDERLLFRGNPVRDGVELQVSGDGDRVVSIEASDGGAGYTGTIVRQVYDYNTPYDRILANILDLTGWTKGEIQLPSGATPPGPLVLYDRPAELLDRIAATLPNGGTWFIRDGALYITKKTSATSERALLISQREGNLIGTPTATRTGCRVRALIDPGLRPQMGIQVQSDLVNGYFLVSEVGFSGDNWGSDFYMDVTAKSIKVAVPANG